MSKSEIQERIKNILKQYIHNQGKLENLGENDNLLNIGINSISFIKIIVQIETEFDIEFDENDLNTKSFDSLNDISFYVQSILEEK